ncbi:MAG: lasso peptide biosynthesis B2 protein [Thermoleophilaceae bacterium]
MTVAALRAAWWTWRALPRIRRQLDAGRLRDISVGTPPPLPAHARRGVEGVLRRLPNSCLERALLLQRWHGAQGRPLDVVVGVTSSKDGFRAHAWLEDEPAPGSPRFDELLRLSP